MKPPTQRWFLPLAALLAAALGFGIGRGNSDSPEIHALVGDLDQEARFRLLLERNGMGETDPRLTEIERDAMNANPRAPALIFHALQFTDPAAAINLAFALPPGTARSHALHSLHRSWSERDAPGAEAARRSWNLTPEESEVFEKLTK